MFFSVLTSVTFVIELAGVISSGPSGTPDHEVLQNLSKWCFEFLYFCKTVLAHASQSRWLWMEARDSFHILSAHGIGFIRVNCDKFSLFTVYKKQNHVPALKVFFHFLPFFLNIILTYHCSRAVTFWFILRLLKVSGLYVWKSNTSKKMLTSGFSTALSPDVSTISNGSSVSFIETLSSEAYCYVIKDKNSWLT